jgi:hypothetical protein
MSPMAVEPAIGDIVSLVKLVALVGGLVPQARLCPP